MRRELAHIPIEPLERLRAFPESGRYDAGVYFLWRGQQLLYIGKSRNIGQRIIHHTRARRALEGEYRKNKRIPFQRHTCIVLDSQPIVPDLEKLDAQLRDFERAYIAAYEPPYNCTDPNPAT